MKAIPAIPMIAMMVLLSVACEQPEPIDSNRFVPLPLIDGIPSGSSWADVRARIESRGLTWRKLSDQLMEISESSTSVDFVEIEIEGYTMLGHAGRLVLWFFEDRLTRAMFFPRSFEDCVLAVERTLGESLLDNKYGVAREGVVTWAWRYKPGEEFIGWRDEVLTKKYSQDD